MLGTAFSVYFPRMGVAYIQPRIYPLSINESASSTIRWTADIWNFIFCAFGTFESFCRYRLTAAQSLQRIEIECGAVKSQLERGQSTSLALHTGKEWLFGREVMPVWSDDWVRCLTFRYVYIGPPDWGQEPSDTLQILTKPISRHNKYPKSKMMVPELISVLTLAVLRYDSWCYRSAETKSPKPRCRRSSRARTADY